MLHSYRFSNFFSFKDPTEVSFRLSRHAPADNLSFESEIGDRDRLTKLLAVLGPNGSGKTNLIKPVAFVHWFLGSSFQFDPKRNIPIEPHFSSPNEPSSFEFEAEYDGLLWRYTLEATKERVLKEALYKKTSRQFSYVFIREWQPDEKSYSIKQNEFGFLPAEAQKVRENASLIATAAQYQVPVAAAFANASVCSNVVATGRNRLSIDHFRAAANFFADEPSHATLMSTLLHEWDLGLERIEISKVKTTDKDGVEKEINLPLGFHHVNGKSIPLTLHQESSGTQAAFVLLSYLLPTLATGGLASIDEMESDLHPHMLAPILKLFIDPKTNPRNAQLLFTCHSVDILNQLHKAQVVLVEKDRHCNSEAWRLDSVKGLRADDNLYAKYKAGAYRAIPRL